MDNGVEAMLDSWSSECVKLKCYLSERFSVEVDEVTGELLYIWQY